MTGTSGEPRSPPERIRVTAEDLARAAAAEPPGPGARTSQLAVASFVLGLLGIPLVGLVLGPVAIFCGVLALGAIQREGMGGLRLAVAGVALGSLGLVGWTAGLVLVLSRPVPPSPEPSLVEAAARAPAGIAEAPPHIRRALRANVFVRCRDGRALRGAGSGVIVGRKDDAYFVLTNRHVVECAGASSELSSATVGGTERPAAVVWGAPGAVDAVLLRVDGAADAPEPAAGGPGSPPRVGDAVFAVGNPLGYEATYTAGVLSAVRPAAYGARELRVYQVQVAVNSGNSGGGLYDAGGNLVGLVTWTADKSVAEGIGFAVAVEDLLGLLREDAPAEVAAAVELGGERKGGRR